MHAGQGYPTVRCGKRANTVAGEVGIRGSLVKVTHAGELEKLAGLQGEVILQPPGPVRLTDFEAPALAGLSEPEGSGRIRLFDVSDESQWLKKVVAETDIGQPRLLEIDAQREVVEFLARNSLRIGNAGGEQRDTVARGCE